MELIESVQLTPLTSVFLNSDYWHMFLDPETARLTSHAQGRMTRRQAEEYVKRMEDEFEKPLPGALVWGIMCGEFSTGAFRGIQIIEGQHCGNVSLQTIDWNNRSAELAIYLKKEYWNKGIGHAACQQVLDYGFRRLNLRRIWTGTREPNIGMRKLAEKLGMMQEGIFRQAAILEGKWVDVYEYGILAEEWIK